MLDTQEVFVPRASGPTIARWQLASQLKSLREAAKITQQRDLSKIGAQLTTLHLGSRRT